MEVMEDFVTPTVVIGFLIGASVLILFYILNVLKSNNVPRAKPRKNVTPQEQQAKVQPVKPKPQEVRLPRDNKTKPFAHPWLAKSLKGHTNGVSDMDLASNGRYLASAAEDRTVLLWDSKDLAVKDHKSLRINVEFDHPTGVRWSPDSKAFIISKYHANTIEVYKVEKKKDGWLSASKAITFPKVHEDDIIGIGIACNGKYIMTCSNKTDLVIWDLKGQVLAKIDTYLMSTSCAKISPCGRFIVASGFAPDVKVWEVVFTKSGEFQEAKRVFELTGHSSGVYDVAFDVDTSHIATVSKDGTWKLFDTKIDYKRGEDPRLKVTGSYEMASASAHIALSPNAEVVVVGSHKSLLFYAAITGELHRVIENIFEGSITSVLFDSTGKFVLTSGDKQVSVFHNITGYYCDILTAKEKLKVNQTSATKERLEKIVKDNRAFLELYE